MRALFDTHLLIWISEDSPRLSKEARRLYDDPLMKPVFSVASLWEVVIKSALRRQGFNFDPTLLRQGLLAAGWQELQVVADHATAVATLPLHHHDPFDRLLIAQARVERLAFVTADRRVAPYGHPVQLV